jgi:hypothetical protein
MIRTLPQGTTAEVRLCVPLNPFNTPTVAADKHYATANREIGAPGKGRITQQGWAMPTQAHPGPPSPRPPP